MRWPIPLLVLAACSRGEAPSPVRPPVSVAKPAQGTELRVLSFNVNYNLADDPDAIAIVRDAAADLVLLQESNEKSERALSLALGDRYPHRFFEHRKFAAGMGVLSRYPFREKRVVDPPPSGWFPALRVVVTTPIGEFEAIDVHLHPQVSESGSVLSGIFTTGRARREEAEALVPLLRADLPTIVAGDFNESSSGGAIGIFERAGLARADLAGNTWRWNTSFGEVHAELDHVMVDERLEVVKATILERGNSDHFPLLVELRRK